MEALNCLSLKGGIHIIVHKILVSNLIELNSWTYNLKTLKFKDNRPKF